MPDVPRRPAIFAYEVPACARDVAYLHHLPAPEQLHLTGMLQQITAIEEHLKQHHLVEQPEEAELFWVPAYFPLLFWLDQRTEDPEQAPFLQCVREVPAAECRLRPPPAVWL
ncbi:unnamed protein product [Effrenium voratum]|nr:unnamed protein product [Effrenium voratum]